MVLLGLKGNDMEILMIILYVLFLVSFVIWIYFFVQTVRKKQPIYKMCIWIAVVSMINIAIQIIKK